jgi:hypothetical protein
METPRHHRDEAQTCLELARLMIDPHAARILRAAAAQHIVQGTELEAIEASPLRSRIVGQHGAMNVKSHFRQVALFGEAANGTRIQCSGRSDDAICALTDLFAACERQAARECVGRADLWCVDPCRRSAGFTTASTALGVMHRQRHLNH